MTVVAAVATFAGCTTGDGEGRPTSTVPGPSTSSRAPAFSPTTTAAASPLVVGELPPSTIATLQLVVPPLPHDLDATPRPTGADELDPADHEHESDSPGSDQDAVSGFVVAFYTLRFDDPPSTRHDRLATTCASPELAAAAASAAPVLDVEQLEVTWPIITSITPQPDGWWHTDVTLKTTRAGQVGPISTPISVRVHLAGRLVDRWELST